MSYLRIAVLVIGLVALSVSSAIALPPPLMTVQGQLTDSSGAPLPAGSQGITVRIYDDSTLGSQIWPPGAVPEIHTVQSDNNGLWSTILGTTYPLTDEVFTDSLVWLEITHDDGAMKTTFPRVRLTTGGYAHRVSTVDGASGGTIRSPVTIGLNNTNSGVNGFVAGTRHNATGDHSSITGGAHNQAHGSFAHVGGGGGSSPGDSNAANGEGAFIGGGRQNVATNFFGVIGGGRNNLATFQSTFIGGGEDNTAEGQFSSVMGGHNNHTLDGRSVICGGQDN
ncbi:MAG: hypothetical protein GF341_01295, partial [candidate division Zixibacteria bacterium]|nr:hypothetical protein [candidate division Zixibacteria bacterium]